MTRALVEPAWGAGYRVLEVSVGVPVAGHRIRDVRNGLTISPALTPSTLPGIALKPQYWIDVLRSPAITFANSPPATGAEGGITIENMTPMFDPSLTWGDIAELRSLWPGSLLVKGALSADGAVGRAYLYGLVAGGEAGVDLALALLAAEFKRTMELLGVPQLRSFERLANKSSGAAPRSG